MNDTRTIRAVVGNDHTEIYPLPDDVVVEWDVMVPTRQGPRLAANVFRPTGHGPWPVIMCCTTYGKDLHPIEYALSGRGPTNRAIGLDMGNMRVSEATPFEAADPGWWVPRGFVVVHVDALGSGKSEGEAALGLGDQVVDAFCDAVTWGSEQAWSNGKVGLNGVSYLAAVQWRIAQRNPRGLAAICPWEGFTDVYSDVVVHGGIPETAFFPWWMSGEKSSNPGDDGGPHFRCDRPVIDDGPFSGLTALSAGVCPDRSKFPVADVDYDAIVVPTLVCGSWSAQGLHSRGAFNGFRRIASEHKFLFTHGRHEWTVSNSEEALEYQTAFFRRFLAGEGDGPPARVRLEVRHTLEEHEVRFDDQFPPSSAEIVSLYLDPTNGSLGESVPADSSVSYESTTDNGVLRFVHRFERDTEVTGPMALRCYMSTDAGCDMDLFVGVRKFDAAGDEVKFWNRLSRHDIVTHGWLRASRRPDPESVVDPLVPAFDGEREHEVKPGDVMELCVEILPSSTLFESGSSIVLELRGRDITELPNFQHHQVFNCGNHTVWCGGAFPSRLLIPRVSIT
jgi:predicted acyl esterase